MTAMQLRLNPPESFEIVPAGRRHYVAALQNHAGERRALGFVSGQTWEHLTPLIQILGPKTPEKAPFSQQRIAGWVKKVADPVGGHPCFLDTLRLPPNHPTTTKSGDRPVLTVIHAEARQRGMAFVPVLRLADPRTTIRQVAETTAYDGRGVALRYPLMGRVPAAGRPTETLIKEALDAVEVDIAAADLILDLGFLSEDAEIYPEDLVPSIDQLSGIGEWRSLVMLATSMHRSLGGGVVPEGTVGRLPRREWQLWSGLTTTDMARLPTYGDYAVQHPDPPWDGEESGPGMRANVRYTVEAVTLVPRGLGAFQLEGGVQYRRLCRLITEDEEFAGPLYSWGDRKIQECADGTGETGSQPLWRGAGTSHHLRYVVDQLGRPLS